MTIEHLHPLSEFGKPSGEITEPYMNTWAFASLIVDASIKGNDNAIEMLKNGLASFNPMLNFDAILAKIKSGDEAAIYQVINWMKEGVDNKLDKAFNK